MGSDDDGVLAANAAFYELFAAGDEAGLEALWSQREAVACTHPGWATLHGRRDVMESWRAILRNGAPPIRFAEPRVHRSGDVAFVTCVEQLPDGLCAATNIFAREDGLWRMVHHHAGPISAAVPSEPRPPSSRLN